MSAKTITFFGATGGVTIASLHHSLKAGYTCTALVRTPKKLEDLLKSKYNYTETPSNLRILAGNAKDVNNVSSALITESGNNLPDVIVYGIGGTPVFTPNPLRPTLDDPHVCESTSATIFTALDGLIKGGKTTVDGGKPLMGVVSTTGIPPGPRDIPIGWIPLYHWLLPVPHADKEKMETNVVNAQSSGLISDFIILRPTLLTDGERTYGKLRAGYPDREAATGSGKKTSEEGGSGWKGVKGLAIGYFISREDVGSFMFEEVVSGMGGEWKGKRVTLTC